MQAIQHFDVLASSIPVIMRTSGANRVSVWIINMRKSKFSMNSTGFLALKILCLRKLDLSS